MKRTSVWLTTAEIKGLQALSKRTGLQIADLIRRAIDAYLERQKGK